MNEEKDKTKEEFLSRWSRLKREAREEPTAPTPASPAVDSDTQAPELPPVEKLNMDSDFRGFFHPKVNEDLRRSALKKLFSEPHFNVMDGLDTYIDDYSKSDPLPAAMLAQLKHAQKIIAWAREKPEDRKHGELVQNEAGAVASADDVPPLTDQTGTATVVPGQAEVAGDNKVESAERSTQENDKVQAPSKKQDA